MTARRLITALTVALAALTALPAAAADRTSADRIAAASPDKPAATPKAKRKLLIFTLTRGYRHASIPVGTLALKTLGERTGAWETTVHSDLSVFEPESLKKFDAVCLMSTTGELFDVKPEGDDAAAKKAAADREARLKQSLLDYVSGGGGLVGIHAATDGCYKWAAFGELMGGYFNGHPWNEPVVIKADEPAHPLAAALEGKPLEIADEIYQFKDPYSRDKLRVVLSLDTAKTNMKKTGLKRADGDYAVSWIREYGKGRVFYCSLGHRDEVFWNPTVLRHYLAGVQWALGDLAADATPSAKVAAQPPATQPDAEGFRTLFDGKDLSAWDYKEGGWVIEDGALARKPGAGFIWSKEQFGNFVLDLDFKISKKGNSGIFIRTGSRPQWLHTGIEIQVLDSFGKEKADKHDCGAIYDCLEPKANASKPADQWQHITITARSQRIGVVLNGQEVIDMNLDEWTEPHKNPDGTKNKFNNAYKDMPKKGYIGFQDHGNAVWFRNVRIKTLD